MLSLLLALITVVPGNNMPLIDVELDGVKATLLLDTGASHTTLDYGFVTNSLPAAPLQEVQITGSTNVAVTPKLVGVKTITVEGKALEGEMVMTIDLSHLSKAVGRPVHGILGMNHLGLYPSIISLNKGTITWNPTQEDLVGFRPTMARKTGTTFEIMTKTPSGKFAAMLLDTGSTFTFVTPEVWEESEESVKMGAADVNKNAQIGYKRGKNGELNFGRGFKLELTPFISTDGKSQIGSDLLKSHDIYLTPTSVSLR